MARSVALVVRQTARSESMLLRFSNFLRNVHKMLYKEPIAKIMQSVVHIEAQLDSEEKIIQVQGSEWLWQKNLVMSRHHCFYETGYRLSKVLVKFYDGQTKFARLRFEDKQLDIAVLELVKSIDGPTAKYTVNIDTVVGDVVITLGSGIGYQHIAKAGILCHKRQTSPITPRAIFLQVHCIIPKGNSGGLLINQNGVGIGMIQQGWNPLGFAIPIGIALKSIARSITSGNNPFGVEQSASLYEQYGMVPNDEIYEGLYQNLFEQEHIRARLCYQIRTADPGGKLFPVSRPSAQVHASTVAPKHHTRSPACSSARNATTSAGASLLGLAHKKVCPCYNNWKTKRGGQNVLD